ncbi:MAG: hypothetical protein Q8O67_21320 [Deltaproteobacteria bacterium]|nr:hypothetical protein [Deltaproteobacteria bacterium]
MTTTTSSRRPTEISATSTAVLDVLTGLTMFPWPLLKTQAERRGLDPANLRPQDVSVLVDDLVKALERFTSPQKAATARDLLARI